MLAAVIREPFGVLVYEFPAEPLGTTPSEEQSLEGTSFTSAHKNHGNTFLRVLMTSQVNE